MQRSNCAPKVAFGRSSHFTANRPPRSSGKHFSLDTRIEFPKAHDITRLLDHVAIADPKIADSLRGADVLTLFGVEAPCPSDSPELAEGGEFEVLNIACQCGRRP
jgi:hypothetical protein